MSTDDVTKIYLLVRIITDHPVKPTIVTEQWPADAAFDFDLAHAWSKLDSDRIDFEDISLFAGVIRSSFASIKVLDCGLESSGLRKSMREDVAAEVDKRLGKQDWSCAEMRCATGYKSSCTCAHLAVKELANLGSSDARYVWWEIVHVDVVGWK